MSLSTKMQNYLCFNPFYNYLNEKLHSRINYHALGCTYLSIMRSCLACHDDFPFGKQTQPDHIQRININIYVAKFG